MKYKYKVIKEQVLIDGYKYISYGLACRKGIKTACKFNDISLNIYQIRELCDFMNRNDISPVHFYDIIEDFLSK